jgi:hypothetical protein
MKTRLGAFPLGPPGAREAVRRFRFAENLGFDAAFATHVNGQEAVTMLDAAAKRMILPGSRWMLRQIFGSGGSTKSAIRSECWQLR